MQQRADLYSLARHDRVERLLAVLRDAYNSVHKGGRFWSRLMLAHYRANRQEFWVTAAYTVAGAGCSRALLLGWKTRLA